MLALARYGWSGNVREMRNATEYAAGVKRDAVIDCDSLPATILGRDPFVEGSAGAMASSDSIVVPPAAPAFRPMAQEVREFEQQLMKAALLATGGVTNRAADLLSMAERTFRFKLRLYGLETCGNSDNSRSDRVM